MRARCRPLADAGTALIGGRPYRALGALIAFAAHHGEEIDALTAVPVRAFLAELAELSPASRERERAAIASFATWAVRHDLPQADPMDRIDTVKVPKSLPAPAAAADVIKRPGWVVGLTPNVVMAVAARLMGGARCRSGHASVRLRTAPTGFRWPESARSGS